MSNGQNNTYQFYKNLSKLDYNKVPLAEYIWIDGTDATLRSKTKVLKNKVKKLEDLPDWQFDGTSTWQADEATNSEVQLKPVAYYPDPFRDKGCVLVLCETYVSAPNDLEKSEPANTNFRYFAKQIFEQVSDQHPQFGIEQEYSMLESKNKFTTKPLGWPSSGFPGPQGPYYCSVGANHCFGRAIMEAHLKACIYSGISIFGSNSEVMPGQWEFQVGPIEGISICDELWMARYLLYRVGEDFNMTISFEPKLFEEYNGAGCHVNFSTKKTEHGEGGLEYLESLVKKLGTKHSIHMKIYGEDNNRRLTGANETSSADKFTWGIGDRSASVRIPQSVAKKKKGYIEDRRPGSNMDPYVVTAAILDATLIEKSMFDPLFEHYTKWLSKKKQTVMEL